MTTLPGRDIGMRARPLRYAPRVVRVILAALVFLSLCRVEVLRAASAAPASAPVTAEAGGGIAEAILRIVVVVAVLIVAGGFAFAGLDIIRRTLGDEKTRFGLRRHWGGFGGASTGWYLSPGLVRLLLGGLLALFAAMLCLTSVEAVFNQKNAKQPSEAGAASASSAPSAADAGKSQHKAE
ncbi:hypothetical protein AWB79_05396 [Caballeronia hypogeia]|uniref:Uncharacterized protein n=1 Tax=Caballeronia hypogeia TaxID=1777140 RepID=A0A158CHQ1_9BURK|nr:hypothetical protein [Caballeronia hypogeia]SAK81903.1 hypothetical protein AWB79_05396 [Caballeronia hypogeia]